MINLNGKVALITGASRGIGAATAVRFAECGAHLALNYLKHEAEASEIAARARSHGARAVPIQADVSNFEDVRALFDRTVDEFGRLDIVVANAGIWTGDAVDELDESKWQQTIDVNLKGVYACCHFAAKLMKPRGSGSIVAVSSTAGQRGEAFHSHYAASKGGIISLTKSLASELGPHGINVNYVVNVTHRHHFYSHFRASRAEDLDVVYKSVAAEPQSTVSNIRRKMRGTVGNGARLPLS